MDWIVGIGTLALAAGSFWLAHTAVQQVKIMRLQVERSHRPVLVPASNLGEVYFRTGRIAAGVPSMVGSTLVAPIHNVGMGPALNVRGEIEVGGGESVHGSGRVLNPIEGIAAGDGNALVFTETEGNLSLQIEFNARVTYEDIAGQCLYTDVHYNVSTRAYASTVHVPGAVEPPSPLITRRTVV